jgi:hypothetical protein
MRAARACAPSPGPTPVVTAPIVGATRPSHLDDAIASLDLELTGEETARLEAHYTPRADFQGVSDDAELARISARIGIAPAGPVPAR